MGYANWIMVKHDTPDKPEIWEAARVLDIDPDAVFGKMIRVWIWFDTQTTNGYAHSVTKALLNREVGVTGFCEVMLDVGWMVEEDGKLFLPNFTRHNSETTKKRAQSRERMARMRSKKEGGSQEKRYARSVTKASPEEEEEVKKDSSTKSRKKVFKPPEVDEVRAYCAERNNGIDAEAFVAHYESCGWVIGQGSKKMKSWKAAIVTWEKRHESGQQTSISRGSGKTSAREHNRQVNDYLNGVIDEEYGKGSI